MAAEQGLNPLPFVDSIKALELEAEKTQLHYLANRYAKSEAHFVSTTGKGEVVMDLQQLSCLLNVYSSDIVDLVMELKSYACKAYKQSSFELLEVIENKNC